MADVALHKGHVYRAALHLGLLESAFASQIPGQLESLGFRDVEIWDDAAQLPAAFKRAPDLTAIANASHWAQGTYDGTDGEVHPIPSQVLVMRDDGIAQSTTVKPLPANAPQWMPPRKGAASTPLPSPGQPDPACEAGYARLSLNGPCFAVLEPGTKNAPPGLSKKPLGAVAKMAIATLAVGTAVGIGALIVRHAVKRKAAA